MILIVYFIIDVVIKSIYNVYTVLKKKFNQQNMSINSAGNT